MSQTIGLFHHKWGYRARGLPGAASRIVVRVGSRPLGDRKQAPVSPTARVREVGGDRVGLYKIYMSHELSSTKHLLNAPSDGGTPLRVSRKVDLQLSKC